MTDRTQAAGLQVATEPVPLHRGRGAARRGDRPDAAGLLGGRGADRRRPDAGQPGRCCAGATSSRRRSTPGTGRTPASRATRPSTGRSLRRSAICVPEPGPVPDRHRQGRPGDRLDRRPAARGAGDQRPVRAQRRQRPLGIAVRRALRHRRDPRDDGATRQGAYNPVRGQRVVEAVRAFLDQAVPLDGASHRDVTGYRVDADGLTAHDRDRPRPAGRPGRHSPGTPATPARRRGVLLRHHGLHLELVIDRAGADRRGPTRPAIQDVLAEAAVTTIVDFEDSVAAVDAEDKVAAYRNWLGLNTGELSAAGRRRAGGPSTRRLEPDRDVHRPGGPAVHPARPRPAAGQERRPPDDDRRRSSTPTARRSSRASSTPSSPADRRAARPAGRRAPAQQQDRARSTSSSPSSTGPTRWRFTVTLFARVEALLGLAPQHAQDRDDGRGTADLAQPRRRRPRGRRPDRVHQHRLPRPHRRRDPHLHGGRADDPQGGR